MIKNRLIISVLVVLISIFAVSCSSESDKFVGKWYNSKGELDSEIKKDEDTYTWKKFDKGEEVSSYEGLYIGEEGYLLIDRGNQFWGFKYAEENIINKITIFKPTENSKPSEGELDIGRELTRGKE